MTAIKEGGRSCGSLTTLGADVRIMVYEHVFGVTDYATMSWPRPVRPRRNHNVLARTELTTLIHTNILATNRFLHDEASDVFYFLKTVRVPLSQLHGLVQTRDSRFLRNIQIIKCNEFKGHPELMHAVLQSCLNLSRIKTVAILTDCLSNIERLSSFSTVRQWVRKWDLGKLTCVDIGRYVLQGRFAKIDLFNPTLLKLWSRVASTPDDFIAYDAAMEVVQSWRGVTPMRLDVLWASHSSFQIWIGLLDEFFRWFRDPTVDIDHPVDRTKVERLGFFTHRLVFHELAPFGHGGRDKLVPVRHLGPGHDANSLEDASEMLALNIEVYSPSDDGDASYKKPIWSELYGDECEGVSRARWVKIRNVYRFARDEPAPDLRSLRSEFLDDHEFTMYFGQDTIQYADLVDITKMVYFWFAFTVSAEEFGLFVRDRHQFEDWKHILYCQYLTAAGAIDAEPLQSLNRVALVEPMKRALRMFQNDGNQSECFPGVNPAYPDVYPPLLSRLIPVLRGVVQELGEDAFAE